MSGSIEILGLSDYKEIRKALVDAVSGKKENYASIVETWVRYDREPDGFALLTLADTLEHMTKMIYEHYRALEGIFQSKIECYLARNISYDMMAGLAILKGCDLEVISPERYAQVGLRLLRTPGSCEPYRREKISESDESTYRKEARQLWSHIKETWGMDDEE